jgi:hypothetical protein
VQKLRFLLFSFFGLVLLPILANAQDPVKPKRERVLTFPDTLVTQPPRTVSGDSLIIPADTLSLSDSTKIVPRSSIETDITYFAEDSIVADFPNNQLILYKEAWFEYGDMRLDADYILIDWEKSEIYASGQADSLGNITGNPFFKQDGTEYEVRKEMRYNFKTQKAIIKDVVTEQQDGILRGETIKKTEDGSVYLSHGYYTTCKLTTPHWHISSNKIKSIQGKSIVSGPFNLYFNGIPTPLGLPFGIIPDTPEEKASGIIFPSYGQEQKRGLFLRDFGYYFAINDYVHSRVTGDFFTNGGWGVKSQTAYKKLYRYSGSMNLEFQKFLSPDTEQIPIDYNTFRIAWTHSPESRGNSRFAASVNAGSTSYFNNIINPNNFQNNVTSDLSSNINYTKTFTGTPFTMSASMRHSQSVQTGEVNLSLPTFNVAMNRQSPFKNLKFEPLKTLNIAYTFDLQNSISNRITPNLGVGGDISGGSQAPALLPFTLENFSTLLQNANNGAQHRIPISSNFRLFKHFTATGSVSLTELWYLQRLNFYYNPAQQRVDQIVEDGFNRVTFYTSSFNLNTNLYGFYNFKRGKIQTIRQLLTPSVGFNFTPDFSDPSFGYYQNVQVNESGETRLFSRHQGFIYSGAPRGESRAMTFNLRSVLEAKVLSQTDSTEATTKKVPLMESIDFNTSYNFAADSFQLAPFSISARTSFFERRVSVNLRSTIDPYATRNFSNEVGVEDIRTINEFAWKNGQGIGAIRNASLNMNASINPNSSQSQGEVRDELTNQFLNDGGRMNQFVESEINRIATDPSQYIDWDIPWNLTFGYNLSYNKQPNGNENVTQTVNMSGDISFSEKWKINFNTGFDAQTRELTQTMIGIARDLHCWQMTVNWVPFGRFTSYNIDIRVKSSLLQDLKVSRRRSFFDR